MLRFRLLGEPQIWYGDVRLDKLLSRKQLALLIFLVCEGTEFRRERLATLLWGECTQSKARYNLRRALYRMGSAMESIGLELGQFLKGTDEIRFDQDSPYTLDVQEFQDGAIELYGPFLGTLTVNNAPEFEEWQRQESAVIDVRFTAMQDAITVPAYVIQMIRHAVMV